MKQCFWNGILLSLLVTSPLVSAQDDFFGDIDVSIDTSEQSENKSWTVIGWVREKLNYGLQAPGATFSRSEKDWSKFETSAFARLDWQVTEDTAFRLSAKTSADALYSIKDRDNYSEEEVDEFETRFELKDAYFEKQFGRNQNGDSLYLKVGQQIIAWGEAENLRITDLVNTEDQFTFGQQDLEDLRLPVPALRFNYNVNDILFDGVVTYRAGSNDVAPAFDEFDPYIALRAIGIGIDDDEPEKDYELLMRVSGRYSQGDWSVVVADVNDNALDVERFTFIPLGGGFVPSTVHLNQDRFKALGFTLNWTRGSWLAFSEVGTHLDKRLQASNDAYLQVNPASQNFFWREKNLSLAAFGAEYSGLRNTTITIEADYIHIHDHDERLLEDEKQLGYSARVRWTGLNERLQVMGVCNQLPDQGGRVGRFSLDYDWSDSIELGLLWVSYSADQGRPLTPYRNNDSIQLQFEYSFQH